MSAPMVCAILDGRKTQTRRVLVPQPDGALDHSPRQVVSFDHIGRVVKTGKAVFEARSDNGSPLNCFRHGKDSIKGDIVCPFGSPGYRLWVRETWAEVDDEYGTPLVAYRAGGYCLIGATGPRNAPVYSAFDAEAGAFKQPETWRPSIYMHRWASRITLEIVDIRVERLQAISGNDILAEGAVLRAHDDQFGHNPVSAFDDKVYLDLKSLWATGWNSINAKRGYGWDKNPFVWVITFRRLDVAMREAA